MRYIANGSTCYYATCFYPLCICSCYTASLFLELLDPKVGAGILSVVSTIPEDLLGLGFSVAINGEPGVALVGEVALVGLVEADSGGILGDGTGVRAGQANFRDGVLDNVEVLESGGNTVLGGERDSTVGTAADCKGVR